MGVCIGVFVHVQDTRLLHLYRWFTSRKRRLDEDVDWVQPPPQSACGVVQCPWDTSHPSSLLRPMTHIYEYRVDGDDAISVILDPPNNSLIRKIISSICII